MVSRFCSKCGTVRVTRVSNNVINHELILKGPDCDFDGIYPWSFVTQLFRNG